MKTAQLDHPIHDLLAARWSPYGYSDKPLEKAKLESLLEAARWAPSCFNAQPWSFLVAQKDVDPEGFARLAEALVEGNSWAKLAPVLMLSVAEQNFARNGKPNRHAQHDVGMAAQNMALQAQELGLALHQMGGFDADLARKLLEIPSGFEPMAMIAIGYPGPGEGLPEEIRSRDQAPRARKPLSGFAYGARWQAPMG